MVINEHQDQKYTWGDNVGRDLYLLGVNVLVGMQDKRDERYYPIYRYMII